MSNQPAPDVGGRILQYRRRVKLITWVGAGLIAEITVFGAVTTDGYPTGEETPFFLWAIVPTMVLIAGAALAKARVHFEWLADLLQRHITSRTIGRDSQMADVAQTVDISPNWPLEPEFTTQLSVFAL